VEKLAKLIDLEDLVTFGPLNEDSTVINVYGFGNGSGYGSFSGNGLGNGFGDGYNSLDGNGAGMGDGFNNGNGYGIWFKYYK